jgi:hypothetical protein
MRHEDHGFALPVWLSWIAQQRQNHQHQISTGHPSIPSPGPESDWSSSPRACENRAHPASPKTNTRRKESQPKPGSDIEQPPQAIVWTRSRDRDRPAVLKHHIWRPVQSTSKTPCHQPSTQTFAPGAAPYIRECEQAMPTKHDRRSSGAAHLHREAKKRELEVVNETRTPRER